ncbi:MAG: hypothetical protein IK047_03230 [Clostridia bacterium]|nr:hypothetical protein [Clostridia bacterium]
MKKFIALILIVLLSLTVLAACGKNPEESNPESGAESQPAEVSQDPSAKWKNEAGEWTPKQPVKDMGNRTFTICVRGTAVGTYASDDFTTDGTLYGDVLNNAVSERNNKVEETYHVTLVVEKLDDYMVQIRLDNDAQTGRFDAIMPSLKDLAVLAGEDGLYELTSIEGFDLSAPWYDEHATEAFSIKHKVYFTTGDITILNKVCAPSVLFNKEMIKQHNLENPYDLVKEKKWTFDKLVEMGKAVSDVSNADVFKNTYGILAAYADPADFFGAAGEFICVKDEDDLPILKIGKEQRSATVAQKLLDTYANGDDWMVIANDRSLFSSMTDSLRMFGEGHVLFRVSGFSAATKLRKSSDIAFGILPMPLYDDDQDDYISYCGSSCDVAGIAIPKLAPDPEFSAYMIDAYSAGAKNYVTKAYVDINLYQRDAYDNESEEMLDLIFSHIVYDIGECYNFGGIGDVITNLAKSGSTDIVSALKAVETKAETELEEVRAIYNK